MAEPASQELPNLGPQEDPAARIARALLGNVDFNTPSVGVKFDSRTGTLNDPAFQGMSKTLADLLLRGVRGGGGKGGWPS